MNISSALLGQGNDAVTVTGTFAAELYAAGVEMDVIEALTTAMAAAKPEISEIAYGYARWMRRTLLTMGLSATMQQTQFMLAHMFTWTAPGSEDVKSKLRRWSAQR